MDRKYAPRAASSLPRLAFALTLALSGMPAWAAAPSIAGIRPDAEQFARWTGKFKACGEFFHEDEGLLLNDYVSVFSEEIRQDLARQTGQPELSSDEADQVPGGKAYMDSLGKLIEQVQKPVLQQADSTPAQCQAMLKAFVAYYQPYKDRVTAPLRAKQEAEERAQAPYRNALAAFEAALGKIDEDQTDEDRPEAPRRASDVDAARRLLATSQPLQAVLPQSDSLLCDAPAYTDPNGLRFLLTEVRPKQPQACAIKEAFKSAVYKRRYDNAAVLAGHAEPAELPDMAAALLGSAENDPSVNADAATVDYDALALPVLDKLLAAGLHGDASSDDQPLLEKAVEGKEPRMVSALIAHGADPNLIVHSSESPLLFSAIEGSNSATFAALLKAPGIRLNVADHSGDSLLGTAIAYNQTEMATMLFAAGVKLPASTPDKLPALVRANSAAMVKLLLAHGDNARWRDDDGNTLLVYVIYNHELKEVIPLLLHAGLPLNAKNRYGATALNYADKDSSLGFLAEQRQLLLSLGAQPGKDDLRLTLTYGEQQVAAGHAYRIRLANGRVIEGKTDVLGKTSWVPDGQKFDVDQAEPSL